MLESQITLPSLQLSAHARIELGLADVERIWWSACASPLGREALALDPFPKTYDALLARMDEVMEAAGLLQQGVRADFQAIHDVRPFLEHIAKEAVLGAYEVLDVARTLEALARLRDVLESRADDAPRLWARAAGLEDERPFARRIFRSIDEQGQLTDDASPALAELRGRVRGLRAEAQERLEGLIRAYDDGGLLRERNFTLRNERYVLPVRAELQGRVEGIVHDASQTGQTVFIEPRELLEVGNRIKIARAAVLEEEDRILRAFSEEIGLRALQLRTDLARAGDIEATFARGLFAARIDACKPQVMAPGETGAVLDLVGARHPLLAWRAAQARLESGRIEPVVPNDIGFGDRRALVISGPNAGGKTVALKTLGLAALLVRAGMPIPAAPTSRVPLLSAVLSTLGDAQDLDAALSSFSGHLVALRHIVEQVRAQKGSGVLCLLDEVASGTDPAQGAALAQAVLEDLVGAGAFVVATTHYERLKWLALQQGDEPGAFRNASVALDPVHHRPTFQLRLDQVGTSNAFDAARRYGLSDGIVDRAESLLDHAERDIQALMAKLMEQQSTWAERMEQLEAQRAKLEAQRETLQRRLDEVELEAARLRREGARAFAGEIEGARKVVAQAIERAQKGASAQELNEMSHALRAEQRRILQAAEARGAEEKSVGASTGQAELAPGDWVVVATLPGLKLEVLEVHERAVVLARGSMKMRVERQLVRKTRPGAANGPRRGPGERRPRPGAPAQLSEPRSAENTLDLRGERTGEALEMMEAFLDRLLQQGRSRAYVLHGHGTGALKRAVRDALGQSRYVARHAAAEADDGGDACTVVELGSPSL